MSHPDHRPVRSTSYTSPAPMEFSVEAWDPSYGATYAVADPTDDPDDDLPPEASSAQVRADIEVPAAQWRPIGPSAPNRGASNVGVSDLPQAVVFVDGVRRIEARVWTRALEPSTDASTDASAQRPAMRGEPVAGICASYAAGTVCSCAAGAHLAHVLLRRGLFTTDPAAADIATRSGTYVAAHAREQPGRPLAVTLSQALQASLTDLEGIASAQARVSAGARCTGGGPDNLLVVDGPLRGRRHLDRALGLIKTHQTRYLPPVLHAMVASLGPGERTPVFAMGTTWQRHSWYLRLPCGPGPAWAGVVRLECSAGLSPDAAVALAQISQAVLPRYASSEIKEARAPQNLYPIAGLERELRHRLGDARLMYRALRLAATSRRTVLASGRSD